jgi:hypothetical protein
MIQKARRTAVAEHARREKMKEAATLQQLNVESDYFSTVVLGCSFII